VINYIPAAVPLGKPPPTPLNRKLCGPGRFGEEKNLLSLSGFDSLVAIPTNLLRNLIFMYHVHKRQSIKEYIGTRVPVSVVITSMWK